MPTEDFEQAQNLSSQVEQARQRAVLAASDAGSARDDAWNALHAAKEYSRNAETATSGIAQNTAEAKAAATEAVNSKVAAKSSEAAAAVSASTANAVAAVAGQLSDRLTGVEAIAGLHPESPVDGQTANLIQQPDTLTKAALSTAVSDGVGTVGSPVRRAVEHMRIAPSLAPITERMEPLRLAMVQEAGTIYATYSRTGEIPKWEKSVDGGTTWATLSTMPGVPSVVAKLTSGTLIAVQQTATTTVGGSMPKVWRSTDDGVTWEEVPAGLKFGPLSAQGVCEGTDGSVMIAEYGNVAPHQYRLMRSTDDGLTWTATFTSAGTEPQGDPGHIHSVTYDHVAKRHVIFSDRPITGTSGPRIYSSADNGATWSLVGESITVDMPNFVAPMYFKDYIAWGSDNQINGLVSRIKRTDFYAGRFDKVEPVAQLSQKALYFVFPLRPDVWAVSMAGEHIVGPQTGGPGSTMNEVWLVSNNGALVSGGMESYSVITKPGSMSGVRASFPHRRFDRVDHEGLLWANMPTGRPRAYSMVPATQGWEPPSKRIDSRSLPFFPPRIPLSLYRNSLAPDDVVRFVEYTGNQVVVTNDVVGGVLNRAELRFDDYGFIRIASGNTVIATIPAAGQAVQFAGRIDLATNGIGIRAGSGSPEGVVTAPVGTIYLNWNGSVSTALWVKENGAGNTGWRLPGHAGGTTGARPAEVPTGFQYADTTINKLIWWNGAKWVDAMGADV